MKKECEKSFEGERNDLFLDCGSSFIDKYICQNSLNCTLQMNAVYYIYMSVIVWIMIYCMFVGFSHLPHPVRQRILLARLSESIQNLMTFCYSSDIPLV